jgi:hypothetical protein
LIQAGKFQLNIVSIHVVPLQVAQMEMWRTFSKLSMKTDEVPFRDSWQVRPLIWNMVANSNRGFQHGLGLREVCVLVAYRRAEAVVCVCLPGTVGQKCPKLGHNSRWNPTLLLWPRNQTAVLSGYHFQDVSEIQ